MMNIHRQAPTTTDASARFTRRLAAQVVLLNLFVYALAAFFLYQTWQEDEARVATETQNLARVIERSITGILSTADVALRSAADEAERQLAAGALDKPMFDGYIARQTARVTGLEAIRVANAAGDVLYGRGTAPGAPVNIADRDYFQYVRDHPQAGTYIGKPYVGRLTPTWVFNLARRINHPDGSFAGVAYAVFTVDFFNDFFATIHVEQDGVVVLRYDDMAVFARHPWMESSVGQTTVSPELTALLKTGKPAATYSATAIVDNIRRVYSYQKVPDFPFYVFVGQSVNAVIADWRKEALRLASAVLLFTIISIVFARQAFAKRRGEQQAELNLRAANQELELRVAERTTELRHSEAMLRALLDAIPESAFLMQPDGIVLAANATVAQRLGVTLERTVGADIYHLTSAEVAMRRRRYADQVIATGQPARFEDSRGDRILDNAIYPVRDAQGRVTQLAVLGMDITERKQAELALHESEERLRLANRATRDVIWDWDIVNDSQQWNAAGTVALGWRDIVEAPQTAAWWIERVHPEDRQRVDAGFFAVVTDPAQNYWYDEYRFRRLDGSYAQIIDRGYVLRNAQGAAVRMIGAMLDITERKQMEEALRATETNYQELINGMKDTVWVIDFDGNLIDVNSAAVEVTGYTREELLNIGIYGIDSALRREQIHALAQAMSADKVQVFQTCHRTKAGRSFPVEICSSLVTYHGQRAILSIARDITERKHAEETLRQNQQHLARAQQIGRLGSWDWDTQRQTLTWSDELYRIFGVESDFALTYDNIEALLHPEDRRRNAAETQQLLSGAADQTRYEFRIIRPDGEVRHISQNIEVTRDQTDAVARMFGIMQDITERKLAEERLRLSEARYRNLVETQADAISRSDLDGNLSFANDAFCRTFGVKREEVLGTNFQPTIVPEDWPVILAVREAISRPPYRRYAEIRNITSSGIRWIGWDNSAVLDEHGQIIEFQGVGRDITERKLAEEALHRANADLARSNTELERFAYVASHDLQEPLRMVASFVGLLADRYRGQLDADADEFIGFAVDGAKRMQTLINDLLEYSRVGTRGEPLQPTDANVALDDALWNLDLAISEAGATVTHDPLPTVLADPVQLAQLFQNLISNAIKFHGAQPPVVHVSARQTFEVSETSKVSGAQVWQFAVRDNGIGIAPQDHERIFGIFQRLHTREAYAGTGIGLAVCQRIVERHGGRIWVESQLGQGTTFYFTLPAGGDR